MQMLDTEFETIVKRKFERIHREKLKGTGTNHTERYHLPSPSVSAVLFIKGRNSFCCGSRK